MRHTIERAKPNHYFPEREERVPEPMKPGKTKKKVNEGVMLEAANLPAFKRSEKVTGLANVARPNSQRATYIKNGVNGGHIGSINYDRATDEWYIGVMVAKEENAVTDADPCPWKWSRFKVRHRTEQGARHWFQRKWSAIVGSVVIWENGEA